MRMSGPGALRSSRSSPGTSKAGIRRDFLYAFFINRNNLSETGAFGLTTLSTQNILADGARIWKDGHSVRALSLPERSRSQDLNFKHARKKGYMRENKDQPPRSGPRSGPNVNGIVSRQAGI